MSEAIRRSKERSKGKTEFTKDNGYYTPKSFVDKFGVFDYDPATCKQNECLEKLNEAPAPQIEDK